MTDSENMDAMEKGQSRTTTDQTTSGSSATSISTPNSSNEPGFSTDSTKALLPHFARPVLSGLNRFSEWLKRGWGPEAVRDSGSQVVVRQVHGGVNGYPTLAAFLDSDDNFMLYRRFGYLQSRILLRKQEQLRCLEKKLETLDLEQVQESGDDDLLCKAWLGGEFGKLREKLMDEIQQVFLEYANMLQSASSMVSMNRPSSSEYTSVANFLHNEQPLVTAQGRYIRHREDLVTLRPGREHASLDAFVEKVLHVLHCCLIERIFCSKETKQKSDQEEEVYYTRTRIEAAVNVIITFMILVLLILPIYPLYRLTQGEQTAHKTAICISVLLVSTLIFSAVITLFTRAKRHEVLATSAAYCAVLVVFISNVSGQR